MHRKIEFSIDSRLEARICKEGTLIFATLYDRVARCEHPLSMTNFNEMLFSRLSKHPTNTI